MRDGSKLFFTVPYKFSTIAPDNSSSESQIARQIPKKPALLSKFRVLRVGQTDSTDSHSPPGEAMAGKADSIQNFEFPLKNKEEPLSLRRGINATHLRR